MKRHPRMLADAGISPMRYAELKAVCRQYREMRQAAALAERWGRHRMWAPGTGGRDTTGDAAVTLAALPEARRAAMIERAAESAGGRAVGRAILRSVSEGKTFARLRPPCGERQFYQLRLAFFVELDRMMWEEEMGQ